jgi:error-prone DNA polymerase
MPPDVMPPDVMPPWAELAAATAFSFLRAASQPEEMVAQAAALGLAAIGIADRNTVAGVVRAHAAAKEVGVRLLPGSRLVFRDGTPDLIAYPEDRAAWGRLTRLLTVGKLRAAKGECLLDRADLFGHAAGLVLLAVPPQRPDAAFAAQVAALRTALGGQLYLLACRRLDAWDAARLGALAALDVPLVAANAPLYHVPERRPLHDVMTAIRLGTTVAAAGHALAANAEQYLKSPAEMARLFRDHPAALARTAEIVARCRFSLDDLAYEYPDEPVPPGTPAGGGARNDHEGTRADRGTSLRALFPDSA